MFIFNENLKIANHIAKFNESLYLARTTPYTVCTSGQSPRNLRRRNRISSGLILSPGGGKIREYNWAQNNQVNANANDKTTARMFR